MSLFVANLFCHTDLILPSWNMRLLNPSLITSMIHISARFALLYLFQLLNHNQSSGWERESMYFQIAVNKICTFSHMNLMDSFLRGIKPHLKKCCPQLQYAKPTCFSKW